MTGFKLTKNIQTSLSSLSSIDIPVIRFDSNQDRELPIVVVGFDDTEDTMPGYNHFKVNGWVKVRYQGYEDRENELADVTFQAVIDALEDSTFLDTLSDDSMKLHGLYLERPMVEFLDKSNEYTIHYEAFTYYDNNV